MLMQWIVTLTLLLIFAGSLIGSMIWNARRRRSRFRSIGEVVDPIVTHALALSSVEGPLREMDADEYLATAPSRTVSREGVPAENAVYDPLIDTCGVCGHSLGSPGTYAGVPFTLCERRPDGTPCGHYRSSILLTAEIMRTEQGKAREATLRLHYPVPSLMSEDPDIRAFWGRRLK